MRHHNIKIKSGVCGLSFEDISDGGELHRDKQANKTTIERARAALRLFSVGG